MVIETKCDLASKGVLFVYIGRIGHGAEECESNGNMISFLWNQALKESTGNPVQGTREEERLDIVPGDKESLVFGCRFVPMIILRGLQVQNLLTSSQASAEQVQTYSPRKARAPVH